MRLTEYRLTRFQFARDRTIGDSQVRIDEVNVAALELIDEKGNVGLGFAQGLLAPLPEQKEIERVFASEVWQDLNGKLPLSLVHQVKRLRGGNQRALSLPFEEALQVALWDLAAKQSGLALHSMLGGQRDKVRAYASGLDYHLSDGAFTSFVGRSEEHTSELQSL